MEFCGTECDFTKCDEQQNQDCNELTFQERDDAVRAGCEGPSDDLLACADTASCTNGQLNENSQCHGELLALAQCAARGGNQN